MNEKKSLKHKCPENIAYSTKSNEQMSNELSGKERGLLKVEN